MTINLTVPDWLGTLAQNRHTSIPATLVMAAEVAKLWIPALWWAAHAAAIEGTQRALLAYAAIMAGTAKPMAPAPAAPPAHEQILPK